MTTSILCLLLAPAVAADEKRVVDAPAAYELGTPARAEAVDHALTAAKRDETRALDLVKALRASRGVEAARGLGELTEHRSAAVRVEALLGLARVGLRSDKLAERTQARLHDGFGTAKERWAAVVALGAVGDGRDVPTLLALTSPETQDRDLRTAAFRALRAITRARLPFVHARWTYWWKKQDARAEQRIVRALEGLQSAPGSREAIAHEATLAAHGWVLVETVEPALKRWLRGSPAGLQTVACRLAGYLRLADLAPEIARVARSRMASDEDRKAAAKALTRLGVAEEKPAR